MDSNAPGVLPKMKYNEVQGYQKKNGSIWSSFGSKSSWKRMRPLGTFEEEIEGYFQKKNGVIWWSVDRDIKYGSWLIKAARKVKRFFAWKESEGLGSEVVDLECECV
ncbi:hypothetical protein E3N88_25887 [Mikania micrantha]|uniref:Uncharacterized protein n=1 Tax=Mikania micrantha TaxID=192012 RepID=A0A5N6N8T2_9ASTR|nr:hypothetical protein E3N88_25887 [Mikania micrantha]